MNPSLRFKRKVKSTLFLKDSLKNLNFCKKSYAGRNFTGTLVVRHKKKGSKRNYLLIDYRRRDNSQFAVCCNFVYDTNRSAFVALIKYTNGSYSYIISPQGFFCGDLVRSLSMSSLFKQRRNIGDCVMLKELPLESIFFNLELKIGKGAQYSRSAGMYCTILKEEDEKNLHVIKLPTGALIKVFSLCVVTLGKSSNPLHYKSVIGKAGFNSKRGIRPTVRGVAMNPVDHPHGGRTKTSSPEVTPWGKIAKHNR